MQIFPVYIIINVEVNFMKKITLSDIAKKTGYSVNTVSHALRDMKDISKEVKAYINDTAKKMGYIPSF